MLQVDPNWWRTLFDELYLLTDERSVCDEDLTRREVDFLVTYLGLEKEERILDLCGGQGRHSLELARRGYRHLTVLDYSGYLVRHGKGRADAEGLPVSFLRSDARETGCATGRFDCILLLANSFGYFQDDRENLRVLREARRICRPGGRLLLDLLDRDSVICRFRPFSCHRASRDIAVIRERERNDSSIRVRETVFSGKEGVIRENRYAERLFTDRALQSILEQGGFTRVRLEKNFSSHSRSGDYGFMNSRVILTARPA
jgi:D-alanine-D-alanine ligase